jgi:diguanylate cyclase (GGDEF)-like protein
MADGGDRHGSPDALSPSLRDEAAQRRDRDAERRDLAAQLRDGLPGEDGERFAQQREFAAQDREDAAEDRRKAALDRESASYDLAYEGIDSLTGVMRRGVGLAAVQREMNRAERTGETLILAFVDTVGLKAINDTRGHAAGDKVLQEVAACITHDLRSYDLVARIGGDEFVCTLAGQSIAQAGARYREISTRLAAQANGARITIGFASRLEGDSVGDLVDRADQAMLEDRRQ